MFYAALLFPQQWYLFGVLDAIDFKKVEQKQETFIVVVVGAVKTVENWECSFHGAEKRR